MKGRLVDRESTLDKTVDMVGLAVADRQLDMVIAVNKMETASHAEGVDPRSQGEQNTTHSCREQLGMGI